MVMHMKFPDCNRNKPPESRFESFYSISLREIRDVGFRMMASLEKAVDQLIFEGPKNDW